MKSAFAYFLALSLIAPAVSFAHEGTDESVQQRLDNIRDVDVPSYESDLKSRVQATVSYKVDWKSFKKASSKQAEYLGSTLFSMTEFAVNAKTPEIKEALKKVKTIEIAHDKKAKEGSFKATKKPGVYQLRANFAEPKWPEGNGLQSQMAAAIQK